MSVAIALHNIKRVELGHGPSRGISNAITIELFGDGESHDITVFGLPDHIADALAEGIRAAGNAVAPEVPE